MRLKALILAVAMVLFLFTDVMAGDFTNNGDGTVTDNNTGLMWQQDEAGLMNWEGALTYCEGLILNNDGEWTTGGVTNGSGAKYTDWRLPNMKELESITDETLYNPAIDTDFFPSAYASYYWSSTTDGGYTPYTWSIHFADGSGGGEDKSSSEEYVRCVRDGRPIATITSPSVGSTFTEGDTITFNGTGNDAEDGSLTGTSLVWTSNIDNQIGTGESFFTSSLSTGTHTITLTATDSNGYTGGDSVSITVTSATNSPPTATITDPPDGSVFASGETVNFAGTGNDTEDGPLIGSSLVWTSNLDGQIGTGIAFMTTSLSVGAHTITLTATDSSSDTGTDSISISVFQNVLKVPSIYSTIQAAIDAASNGDVVLVADGTHAGAGNKDLDFGGKAITVQSENGPSNCTINCGSNGRGFNFYSGESSNSVVSGFTITNGNVSYENGGGGIQCTDSSSPTIRNCIIINNTASSVPGGGISCFISSPTIINCLIMGNTTDDLESGGGIYGDNASPTITNCTIVGNSVTGSGSGGGIYLSGPSTSKITNCILWNNSPDEIGIDFGTPTVTYSNIQGGYPGTGNIDSDPLFAGAGDYHLGTGSLCIDSGSALGAPSTDIEGNPRPQGSGYDMGAYEATP